MAFIQLKQKLSSTCLQTKNEEISAVNDVTHMYVVKQTFFLPKMHFLAVPTLWFLSAS